MKDDLHLDTLTATALGWIDRETDAMAAPLRPSTSFLRDPNDLGRTHRLFTRDDNPTYQQPEALINRLEGGAGCLLFASGMAAITAVFQRLEPDDHVIVPARLYSGLRAWLSRHGRRWRLNVTELPEYDAASLTAALRPGKTKVVWVETPSNPTWAITDIGAVAAIAHAADALVAIDNTVATPILTRPIEHGADIVLHSCSKYMNGHGDLIAGAVVVAPGREAILQDLQRVRNDYGGVLGTFETWLLLRGMRTLSLRVKAASDNALQIARFLHGHPAVIEVLYPGLATHVNHATAARQMTNGFGAMLSFRVRGGEAAAKALAGRLRVIRQAISFGSTETVIEHRAGMEGTDSPTPRDLLRLSVGIENIADLMADLKRGLDRVDGNDLNGNDRISMRETITYAPRSKRIGLIVPSSNTNVEPDFLLLAAAGVTVHSVRSGGYDVNVVPDSAEMRRFVRQSMDEHVRLLCDARVDVIAYGCTSATLSDGPEFDRKFCEELAGKSGRPAVTTAGALIEAIRSVGARRVAFTSPYVKSLSREGVDFIRNSGIEVVNELAFERELSSIEQNALTPQDAYDMAVRVDHSEAQAIVISCTDYRALEAIPAIERRIGKPVITSNQALIFACLDRLGVSCGHLTAGGRLFTRQDLC